MKLLILGGTVFLGRHIVEDALARGHEVTLFNRGQHNPDIFPEVEKLRGEMEAGFKAFDEQAKVKQQELEAARAENERLLKELPKTTSALYKRISARIRDGVALAEARNGACMACYMSLRPQIMADVRRGEEIITCDNCNRILYYAPDKKAAQPVGA